MNGNFVSFSRNLFRRETTTRAVKVAAIMAPILIVRNHYDEIMDLRFTPVFSLNQFLLFCPLLCVCLLFCKGLFGP
ncbi:MAG: hypothetical protein C4291_02890 [Candidatus Dadabacteria bacterium]